MFSDDSSSESGSGNGIRTLTPPSVGAAGVSESTGTRARSGSYTEVNGNGNGNVAPLDFSTTSSSSSSEDQQPVNLSDRLSQALPSAAVMLATFNPEHAEELRRKYPKSSELRLDRDIRDYNSKVYSFRTIKMLNANYSCHNTKIPVVNSNSSKISLASLLLKKKIVLFSINLEIKYLNF